MYAQAAAQFFSASCARSIKHTPRWLALGPAAVEKHVDSAYRAALDDEIAGELVPQNVVAMLGATALNLAAWCARMHQARSSRVTAATSQRTCNGKTGGKAMSQAL